MIDDIYISTCSERKLILKDEFPHVFQSEVDRSVHVSLPRKSFLFKSHRFMTILYLISYRKVVK